MEPKTNDSLRNYKYQFEDFDKNWEYRRMVTRLGTHLDAAISRTRVLVGKIVNKENV